MRRCLVFLPLAAFTLGACGSSTGDANPKPQPTNSPSTNPTRPTGSSASSSPASTLVNPREARFRLAPIAQVDHPTALAVRKDDDTLFVTEQAGRVRAIRKGALDPTAVIDLRDTIAAGGEQGLLGLTFSPDGTTLYAAAGGFVWVAPK